MSKPKLKVGDVVWFVPWQKYHGKPRALTVTKIGRKWATLGGGYRPMRAEVDTWDIDHNGFSLAGSLYASEEAWQESEVLQKKWEELRLLVERRYHRPAHMTRDRIESAIKAIKDGDQ